MNSAAALAMLQANPANFLRNYPLKCAGAPAPLPDAANFRQYHINKIQGDAPVVPGQKVGHRGATRPGLFGAKNISSFKLAPGPTVNGAVINHAHVVPMVNHNSDLYGCLNLHGVITAMPYYRLDANHDGVMVTGELSGCCFAWGVQGVDLVAIHVQPVGGISADALQLALATTGRFAAFPAMPLATFGRQEYPAGRASIVGIRTAGAWTLYAQTSDDGFNTMSGAFRIYPGVFTRL